MLLVEVGLLLPCLAAHLLDFLEEAGGVGVAAPQHSHYQLLQVDVQSLRNPQYYRQAVQGVQSLIEQLVQLFAVQVRLLNRPGGQSVFFHG